MSTSLHVTVTPGLTDLPAEEWNALVEDSDPFLEHGFLHALETSNSVGAAAGWQPRFVVARRGRELVGAIPAYMKSNSYGEFIFDWGWASGAHRAGVAYYPKLTVAVPFTPVTGRRILVRPGEAQSEIADALLAKLRAVAVEIGASSIHFLFCGEDETESLRPHGYRPRLGLQFHWHNRRPEPYRDFDDYLATFRSQNRKQVRKERTRAAGHGFRLATIEGPQLGDPEWRALERLYERNAERHGSMTYLTPGFFHRIRATHAHRVVANFAYRGDDPVAGTLNFERGRHLYGRYWGTSTNADMLHFELCYHALIERAIARGLDRFEAGAQGEHKLKRGLLPAFTHSAHLIFHPGLANAVAAFVAEEALVMRAQHAAYTAHSPFAGAS